MFQFNNLQFHLEVPTSPNGRLEYQGFTTFEEECSCSSDGTLKLHKLEYNVIINLQYDSKVYYSRYFFAKAIRLP